MKKHLRLSSLLATFASMILLYSVEVVACSCVSVGEPGNIFDQVTGTFNSSTAVFSGRVIGFEWRKEPRAEGEFPTRFDIGDPADWETKVVRIKVYRWWRMSTPIEICIYTDERRNLKTKMGSGSSCDYGLEKDTSYLVYAGGPANRLQTHACARTMRLDRAEEDLKVLGKGEEPRAEKVSTSP